MSHYLHQNTYILFIIIIDNGYHNDFLKTFIVSNPGDLPSPDGGVIMTVPANMIAYQAMGIVEDRAGVKKNPIIDRMKNRLSPRGL